MQYSKTLGNMINEFDNSPNSTVKEFNQIFFLSPIALANEDDVVDIGEPTTAFTRLITINNTSTFFHDFRPLRSEIVEDILEEKEEWKMEE